VTYTINRNGQLFGPYSRNELQQYLSQGFVSMNDLACVDGDQRWFPVHGLLSVPPLPPTPGTMPPPPPAGGQLRTEQAMPSYGRTSATTNRPAEFSNALFKATPTSFVMPLIILANVLVFVLMLINGVSPMEPAIKDLLAWGADFGPLTTNGEWWRVLSSTFVHIGVIHILMNMYVLFSIGKFTERLFGHFGFAVLYLLSGVGGSLASLFWHPQTVSAGASGAIFGLYGGLLAFLLLQRHAIPAETLKSLTASTGTFLLYNVIYGVMRAGTDMAAHVGGLLTGFLIGLLLTQSLARVTLGSRALRGTLALAIGTAGIVLCAAQIPVTQDSEGRVGVTIGSKDEVYYSGSATKDQAVALGEALKSEGYFQDRGVEAILSKNDSVTAVSFIVKDGTWNRPASVLAFEEIGRKIAPVIGGFPITVRLLDTSRDIKKEVVVGKVSITAKDDVYYSGSATESEARNLGETLKSEEFFRNDGADVFLAKGDTGTILSFVVEDGAWDDPAAVSGIEDLIRKAAASVGGLPVTLRLIDDHLRLKKETTVR